MQFKRSSLPVSTLPYGLTPQVYQVLKRLPKSVVAKLSEEELLALYKMMTEPQKRAIDVRVSLPLFPKRLYFVALLGLERRAQERIVAHKKQWTSTSIFMAMTMGLITTFALGGAGYRVLQGNKAAVSSDLSQPTAVPVHPVALPWIVKESDCRGQSRHWQEGFCYEQDHDPQF